MRRRLWATLISTVVIVIVLFVGALATNTLPILGLDLQGGVSVILAPVEAASGDDLIVIRDLIRSELENQGIAEPDVRVQGQAIVVDLPGVKDQQEALDAVDVSGVVELRPGGRADPVHGRAASRPGDVTADHDPSTRRRTVRRRRHRPPPAPTTVPAGFRGCVPGPDGSRAGPRGHGARDGSAHRTDQNGADCCQTRDGTQRVRRRRPGHR